MDDVQQQQKKQRAPDQRKKRRLMGRRNQEMTVVQQGETEELVALRTLFHRLGDGAIVYDREGKIRQINPMALKMFGVDNQKTVLGMLWGDFLQRYGREDDREIVNLAGVGVGEETREVILHLTSGNTLQIRLFPLLMDKQGPDRSGGICILHDITHEREQERSIQKTLKPLLALIEEMERLPKQVDVFQLKGSVFALPDIVVVLQQVVELIVQVLACEAVQLIEIDAVTGQLHLVAESGPLTGVEQHPQRRRRVLLLSDFLDEKAIKHLYENDVVLIDRQQMRMKPEIGLRSGEQKMLLAPIFLGQKLVAGFAVARSREGGMYSWEEIALVKAIVRLIVQVIGRIYLLHEWAQAHANELALKEMNERFDEFLSLASHELRTPLTTVRGNIQLAQRRLQKIGEKVESRVDQAEKVTFERVLQALDNAVERTYVQDRMIDDLLDASRIQANKFVLRIQPTDIIALVERVVADQRQRVPERKIVVQIRAEQGISALIDADRIEQVMTNYLTNALKYSPASEPVDVTVAVEEQVVRVSVHDRGPGIPAEEQERVWRRFYRVKGIEVQNEADFSLGLGLYICKKIIELHHGKVGVESAPDEGATFWFTLPLVVVSAEKEDQDG